LAVFVNADKEGANSFQLQTQPFDFVWRMFDSGVAMDPLSLTANIAAVIGLLDAVCRLGKETHKVISGIKHH
jgi:hypothetical protein